ncbi:hypothetical protein Tco_0445035 [Tanacetum coccineum]
MAELVRLQICIEIDDTWAWVASGSKRQPDAAVGALEAAEDVPVCSLDDEGAPASHSNTRGWRARVEEDEHGLQISKYTKREYSSEQNTAKTHSSLSLITTKPMQQQSKSRAWPTEVASVVTPQRSEGRWPPNSNFTETISLVHPKAPQPPPLIAGPARTMGQRLAKVEEDVHEIRGALGEQREILDSMARDFS